MTSPADTSFTVEVTEQNLAMMNAHQTGNGALNAGQPQTPPSDISYRNWPAPKLVVSTSDASSCSSGLPRYRLKPDAGQSPRLRSKSPQVRQQLILRTSSPNFQPRTFTTYCHSPGRSGTPVSDTSSDLRGSLHNPMYIPTISQPDLSSTTTNLPTASSNHTTDNSSSTAQANEGNFVYANPAFDTNDELILDPTSLCKYWLITFFS